MAGGPRLGAQIRLEGDRCGLKLMWRAGRFYSQIWYWGSVMYRSGVIKQWRINARRDRGGFLVQVLRLYAGFGIMPAREVVSGWWPAGWRRWVNGVEVSS